ncbi:KRUF family protein [Besnoitia besnoiti]|uniref:KRUF family protein n=1 Tax=Besnoitia besnoiti TaxID=94643 RepID=A0A2A9MDG5_BESBE|nr:KRUF family protein [Besnoitia besnoiti]PFH33996.1 KRUF family protein [Besnoitia besnoiti]
MMVTVPMLLAALAAAISRYTEHPTLCFARPQRIWALWTWGRSPCTLTLLYLGIESSFRLALAAHLSKVDPNDDPDGAGGTSDAASDQESQSHSRQDSRTTGSDEAASPVQERTPAGESQSSLEAHSPHQESAEAAGSHERKRGKSSTTTQAAPWKFARSVHVPGVGETTYGALVTQRLRMTAAELRREWSREAVNVAASIGCQSLKRGKLPSASELVDMEMPIRKRFRTRSGARLEEAAELERRAEEIERQLQAAGIQVPAPLEANEAVGDIQVASDENAAATTSTTARPGDDILSYVRLGVTKLRKELRQLKALWSSIERYVPEAVAQSMFHALDTHPGRRPRHCASGGKRRTQTRAATDPRRRPSEPQAGTSLGTSLLASSIEVRGHEGVTYAELAIRQLRRSAAALTQSWGDRNAYTVNNIADRLRREKMDPTLKQLRRWYKIALAAHRTRSGPRLDEARALLDKAQLLETQMREAGVSLPSEVDRPVGGASQEPTSRQHSGPSSTSAGPVRTFAEVAAAKLRREAADLRLTWGAGKSMYTAQILADHMARHNNPNPGASLLKQWTYKAVNQYNLMADGKLSLAAALDAEAEDIEKEVVAVIPRARDPESDSSDQEGAQDPRETPTSTGPSSSPTAHSGAGPSVTAAPSSVPSLWFAPATSVGDYVRRTGSALWTPPGPSSLTRRAAPAGQQTGAGQVATSARTGGTRQEQTSSSGDSLGRGELPRPAPTSRELPPTRRSAAPGSPPAKRARLLSRGSPGAGSAGPHSPIPPSPAQAPPRSPTAYTQTQPPAAPLLVSTAPPSGAAVGPLATRLPPHMLPLKKRPRHSDTGGDRT